MAIKNFKAFLPTIIAFSIIAAMNQCQNARLKRETLKGEMLSRLEVEAQLEPKDSIEITENESIESEKTNIKS